MLLLAAAVLATGSAVKIPAAPLTNVTAWLHTLEIHVSEFNFTEGLEFKFRNLTCGNLTLGKLSSGSSLDPPSYQLSAGGLGIQCNTVLEMDAGSLGLLNAMTRFAVADSSLALNIHAVTNASTGLIDKFVVDRCDFSIDLSVLDIDAKDFKGFWETVAKVLRPALPKVLDSELKKVVTQLVQTNLTNTFAAINRRIAPFLQPRRPITPPPAVPSTGIYNLKLSPAMVLIDYFLDDVIGPSVINKAFDFLTNYTGHMGLLDLSHLHVNATLVVPGLGNLTLGLSELNVSGLDTWRTFDLLEPTTPVMLSSRTKLMELGINASLGFTVAPTGPLLTGASLFEAARVVLKLEDMTLQADMQVALLQQVIEAVPATALLNASCFWTSVYDLNMTTLDFNMTLDQLAIVALGAATEQDIDTAIDNLLAMFIGGYSKAIPAFFDGFVATSVRESVNGFFAQEQALPHTCSPAPTSASQSWASQANLGTTFGFGGAALLSLVVILGLCLVHRRRRYSYDNYGGIQASYSLLSKANDSDMGQGTGDYYCLASHPRLPTALRYGVPVLILVNIGVFVSSNSGVGATVKLVATYANDTLIDAPLFDFSLGNSVHDMWEAGVYPLSLLIAVFSGAWPYAKLLLMLYCWLAGPRWPTYGRREGFLMLLDMFGKWSLIDAYVLVLMMIAFHLRMEFPEEGHLHQPLSIDIVVEAGPGIYSFVVATMSSLCITHVVLAALRRTKRTDDKSSYRNEDNAVALRSYHFSVRGRSYHCTIFGQLLVVLVIFSCVALVLVGSYMDSFAFHFRGVVALLMPMLGDQTDTTYSLISAGMKIPGASQSPNSMGIRFIQATFFTFAFAVPLAHMAVLLFLWVLPLRVQAQRRLYTVAEVLNAWSALEVFVVALMAALLEIHQFAQFIIGDKCDAVNKLLVPFNSILDGYDTCFDVSATLAEGCWTLFAASLVSIIVGMALMRLCHLVLAERLEHRKDGRDKWAAHAFWSTLAKILPCAVRDEGFLA